MTCALALGLFAFGAQAATDAEKADKEQYNAAVARADADYKAATEACKSRQGNDKDVCMQQAKANRDKAKADAKAMRKNTRWPRSAVTVSRATPRTPASRTRKQSITSEPAGAEEKGEPQ